MWLNLFVFYTNPPGFLIHKSWLTVCPVTVVLNLKNVILKEK